MNRFYLQVYGCQMNQYEAGLIRTVMCDAGYQEAGREEEADVLLMLTCAVRSHAEQRALGRLGTMRRLRSAKPGVVIGVLGCMSQHLKQALTADRLCDIVVGPDQYRRLPELVGAARAGCGPAVAVEQTGECYDGIFPQPAHPVTGSVTVMRGCNNFCSYCIVPYARGRERSKSPDQVLAEVRHLAGHGVKDLTLLGQNVLAYRHAGADFADLLERVSGIPGIERIRFLTSHPKDLTDRFLTAIAGTPGVCPSLHLPVQSGSNRILALMNRGYTREQYLDRVTLTRRLMPGTNLTTDIMVGFPSETEEDFFESLDLVRRVRFDAAYMFRFSSRPGTAAAGLLPKVSEAESSRRLSRLIEVQNRITREENAGMVGKSFELLIESESPRGRSMLGRTAHNKTVIVSGPVRIGTTVTCRVTGIRGWTPVADAVESGPRSAEAEGGAHCVRLPGAKHPLEERAKEDIWSCSG